MTEYGVWLSWNNQQESFQLPINPSSIEMSDGNKGQTYDVARLGEINVIKNPALTTYKLSGIFPAPRMRMYYTGDKLVDPLANAPIIEFVEFEDIGVPPLNSKTNPYVAHLLRWMATRRPIRFNLCQ